MMKILILGSGAREHALAWKISKSDIENQIYIWPGNGAVSILYKSLPGCSDIFDVLKKSKEIGIDLIISGNESYLSQDISGLSAELGINFFGPNKIASKLESSKSFAKDLMTLGQIPTADYIKSYDMSSTLELSKKFFRKYGSVILKADGLAGGKGVFVCDKETDIQKAVQMLYSDKFLKASDAIVIEKKLIGREVSAFVMIDSKKNICNFLDFVVDYKRLKEGDKGPNTGGMGCYSPVFWLPKNAKEIVFNNIIDPTLKVLSSNNIDYLGWLYIGIMWTEKGPYVLEYNVRLGDPEAQVLALNSDFDWLYNILNPNDFKIPNIIKKPSICVNLVSKDYPFGLDKAKNYILENDFILNFDKKPNELIFFGNTYLSNDKVFTGNGRIMSIVQRGDSFGEIKTKIYKKVNDIKYNFNELKCRYDIGKIFL